jgi:hypothetical protein
MDKGCPDLLTASMALAARESTSIAQDIPLFGLRKKLRKAKEEAKEIAREGFQVRGERNCEGGGGNRKGGEGDRDGGEGDRNGGELRRSSWVFGW